MHSILFQVKGLAEMTNQSSALRESEREQEHLRPPLNLTPKSETLDTTTSTNATNSTNSKRLKPERCSPSPTRQQQSQNQSTTSRHTPDEYFDNKTRHQRNSESFDKIHGDSTPQHSHHSIHHLSQSAVSQHIRQQVSRKN